jgi:hypothetical protein
MRDPVSWVRADGPGETTLFFDFDNDFLSLHTTTAIQRMVEYFVKTKASGIEVAGFRGSSKLSNGNAMIELPGIAAARAVKVRDILAGLGIPQQAVSVRLVNEVRAPNGIDDPWSRKVTLSIKR